MPRRCSVQGDKPHYMPPAAPQLNVLPFQQQSQVHPCVQKSPLRNVLSAPSSGNIDPSRLLPRVPIVQRSDTLQSSSTESVNTKTAVEARYKTELCRPFEERGTCRYGEKCQFAHGRQELHPLNRHPKYKTEFCKNYHSTGFCMYGPRCNFIHDEERQGPVQSTQSNNSPMTPTRPRPSALPSMLPINTSGMMTSSDSTSSSISSGSPTQSPTYLHEETNFARLSPAPSFGSDGASLASTYSPPGSPKHDLISDCYSPLDMGFSLVTSRFGNIEL